MKVRAIVIVASFLAGVSSPLMAGEQYVDSSGFAVSGYDVVAYFDLEQKPKGETQLEAIRGSEEFTTEYNMAMWAFSSVENLEKFKSNPAKFAPQYDGHCAYGVARNGKVPANPNLWRIVDDKLYLNIAKSVVEYWEKDIPYNIIKADRNWSALESDSASENEVPEFDGPLGPVGY